VKEGGPGWGRVIALAIVASTLSVVPATLLVFLPVGLLLVALPPRRPALMLIGAVLVGVVLGQGPDDPLIDFARGWSLVAGGWLVIATILMERPGYVPRGLFAVAATVATAGVLYGVRPGAIAGLDSLIRARMAEADAAAFAVSQRWGIGENVAEALNQRTEIATLVQPALLVLATLAALGVAWWAYRRLAARDAVPLAGVAQFRFPDALIWALIAGIILLVAPVGDVGSRAGANLVTVMGLLYALRGVAVLVFLHGMPGVFGWLMIAVLSVLLLPLVLVPALVIGLSDTWLDIRSRRPVEDAGG
jgi:hypothetical protein